MSFRGTSVTLGLVAAFVFASALAAGTSLVDTIGGQSSLSNLTALLGSFPNLTESINALQNITFLAPNNDAFATYLNSSANATVLNDPQSFEQLIFYHVLNGTYSTFTDNTIYATLLQSTGFWQNNVSEVVKSSVSSSTTSFYSGVLGDVSSYQLGTIDGGEGIAFDGGILHIIDQVLTIPYNASVVAISMGLTAALGALEATELVESGYCASDGTSYPYCTMFLPSNDAFQAIDSVFSNLTTAEVKEIMIYHLSGANMIFYTSNLSSSVHMDTGDYLTITNIDGAIFVNNAKIQDPYLNSDILISGGVIHIIDQVLNPVNITVTPSPGQKTGEVMFAGASAGPLVPFTSGIPAPSITPVLSPNSANSISTNTATGATPSASSSSAPNTSHGTHHGISGGAIAGIVIGAIAGLLLAGLLIWWCIKRGYKVSISVSDANARKANPERFEKPELAASATRRGRKNKKGDNTNATEMEDTQRHRGPLELPNGLERHRSELPGSEVPELESHKLDTSSDSDPITQVSRVEEKVEASENEQKQGDMSYCQSTYIDETRASH